MKILVASIPSSGTLFVFEHLLANYKRGNRAKLVDNEKYLCHFTEPAPLVTCLMENCITIVPVRRPEAIVTSWERDGADLDLLFTKWLELPKQQEVYYLPVDSLQRNIYLYALSIELKQKLRTNWKPHNCSTKGQHQLENTALVQQMYKARPDFCEDFW